MITTNMPKVLYLDTGNAKFYIGERIRTVLKNYNAYIGEISEIHADSIVLHVPMFRGDNSTVKIWLSDIEKLRRAEPNETFETVPYYDSEEKEFWRTHWYTRDGIKEKSQADIDMLEEFFKNQNN